MSERWQQVMDDQLDLLRFWQGDGGARTAQGFGQSMKRVAVEENEALSQTETLTANLQQLVIEACASADPFYVDANVMDVVEAAAETFNPEPLHETDLPTMNAFVVLPRPMSMWDRKDRRLDFRAFMWRSVVFADPEAHITENGVLLFLFSHLDDEDEVPPPDGWDQEKWRQEVWSRQGTPYTLAHVTPWVFGHDVPRGDKDRQRASWWTPVQAFLRLSLQTLTTREEWRPPRQARKRWQRERPHHEGYMTVVRLRRPRSAPSDEERDVNWAHRWIVSGHWRNQWFPSLKTHRQVWIGSYVKGPEDKPLLLRRGRAFELVR